jgi:glycosyltransferase involved in cell wall biosynthesis
MAGMQDIVDRTFPQVARRGRQVRNLLATEGLNGVSNRVRRVLADWIRPGASTFPVRRSDIMAADLSRPSRKVMCKVGREDAIVLNWVTTPPGEGSGGHTTLFRIINYLAACGYQNRVYFYDVYGADLKYYEGIARGYFGFTGEIDSVDNGIKDAHALIATSWPTAYPVFAARCSGARFYFVQDFEPFFHATGAESVLAENTYKMGFQAITAGRWLATKLRVDYGMKADHFDFGCDTSSYRLLPQTHRPGVAFYARPKAMRRGYEIGIMALEILAKRQPQVELHLYGEKLGRLHFRFVDHGSVRPADLNVIYNRCFAGLSLSLTNASLVPHEMLAAGCIPVVNEADHNRIVLDNPFVRYAAATPHDLASELEALLRNPAPGSLAERAAASVRSMSWEDAGRMVDAAFRRALCRDGT